MGWLRSIGATALAAASAFAAAPGPFEPVPIPGEPPPYESRCAAVESSSIDGFVENPTLDTYRAFGELRFVFSGGGAPRPEILVQSDVEVPPGATVRVARARLEPPLRPGETCRVDAGAALRKRWARSP